MKLYKIRGTSEWVPWDVLYNERGYNSVPCVDMAYKSISPWGTSAGTGYRTNGAGNIMYFVSGETGWKLAFNLPEDFGVYPDEATPIQMIKDGVISDAVWMEFFGAKWYLIQAEIANERYWIHELALPEYGWEIYEGKDYEFLLVDGTTGRVVHGVEQLNEMVFAPTGYFTIEDTGDVVFVEQSPYPIVSRFHVDFDTVQTLADGAYIDTVLPYYTSKLYIAGIVDRVAETVVDFGLTVSNEGGYVRVTNNTGASVTLTRLAIQSMDAVGAEVVEVVDRQDNHAYAFKWDDGGTPYWWISYSGERHWTDSLGNWSEVPSVVLPTVSVTGDWGSNNWLYANTVGTNVSVLAGNSVLIGTGGSSSPTQVDYDTTKSYSVIRWSTYQSAQGSGHTEYSIINSNDKIYAQNVTSGDLYLYAMRVAVCSSNLATVITVYNSSNVAFNAFKFTVSGTDYYYVLDGTQTDWTDDLEGIGYSLTPTVVLPSVIALPTVGLAGQIQSIAASGNTGGLREWDSSSGDYNGNYIEFDNGSKYASIEYASGGGGWSRPVEIFEPTSVTVSGTDVVGAKNVSETSKNFGAIKIARCLSSTATVVIVYNSSNDSFNAFKFTANRTDYYYVLDGTQTDWTDDLAGIGYSLTPPFVLPTVTIEFYDAWGSWLNAGNSSSAKQVIASNSISTTWFYKKDGSQYSIFYPLEEPYDSSKSYAVMRWNSAYGIFGGYYGFSIVSENGYYGVKNITSSSISVNSVRIAVCSSNQATVITVYDSSNTSYNAFKFTASGTDYYYVLDGTQTDWTDDLEGIGYSLTPTVVLPSVTEIWTLPNSSSGISTIQSGSANTLWINTPSWAQIPYDVTSCYAVAFWRKANNTLGGRTEFSTENISDLLSARNVSSNAIEVYWIKVAVCSSNQASVVTVYDSGNTAYNSFKYTIDNIDYYYVLDGTQTDWTDDLAGIGYSLTPTIPLGYFTANGEAETTDKEIVPNTYGTNVYQLFDKNGNTIPWDSTKTYSFVAAYNVSGSVVVMGSQKFLKQYNSTGTLGFALTGSVRYHIFRIEYTVS